MQKSTVLCAIAAKRVKKQQTEKKIKKILVQKIGNPYNAPPLRRQRETLHRMVGTTKRKNPEIQG
ncbi:hypothetical protein ACLB1R_23340 [Escherichia coli]